MRTFTHAGSRYLLGRGELGWGIWLIGQELGDPVAGFPPTELGRQQAAAEFQRIEPYAVPLDTAPGGAVVLAQPSYGGSPGYPPPAAGYPPQTNGMATAGGSLGIAGAVLSLIPFFGIVIGLVMGVLAIIFSAVGLSRAGSTGAGKGLAVTGLVLGILTVIFKLIPGVDVL